jgi:hypothetical protein
MDTQAKKISKYSAGRGLKLQTTKKKRVDQRIAQARAKNTSCQTPPF